MDAETIHRRRWAILAVLCMSLVMVVLANSVLNVALPTLQRSLDATNTDLQWIVDAYALVFGGLLLTMGALGDRFGRRGALQIGLAIVGGASIGATFATGATSLIAARAAMGVGAALVMPATLSILTHVFPPQERGKAMGIWAAFAGIGGALGPVVGGWLLEGFDWPAVFWLNVPVVVVALAAGFFLIPASRDPHHTRLDPVGATLSIIALASLLFGIIEGPAAGWTSAKVLAAFGVAAVSWPLFVWWERRSSHPMLPMRFFANRGFSTGNLAIAMAFFVMFAFFFVMTQYLQFVRGYSALQAGVRTLPLAAGLIMAAPRSDALARRIGTPGTVAAGLFLVAACFAVLSFANLETAYWQLGLGFLGLGIGMGFAMAPSTTLIMDSIPGHKAGVGSAMNDTSREVGGALGIAVLGSVVNEVYKANIQVPAGLATGPVSPAESLGAAMVMGQRLGGEAGAALIESARMAFLDAMGVAYVAGAVVALLAAVAVRIWMPARLDADMDHPAEHPPEAPALPPMEPPAAPATTATATITTVDMPVRRPIRSQEVAAPPAWTRTNDDELAALHARVDAVVARAPTRDPAGQR